MRLVSAFKVEEDIQGAWREEREEQNQSGIGGDSHCRSKKPKCGVIKML